MDLVSIIIPYYKKREYITSTLNSVLKQTYKNLEIIIIYDDQDKEDLELMKKLIKLDKRIILIINKKSLGAGLSRNYGIKAPTSFRNNSRSPTGSLQNSLSANFTMHRRSPTLKDTLRSSPRKQKFGLLDKKR